MSSPAASTARAVVARVGDALRTAAARVVAAARAAYACVARRVAAHRASQRAQRALSAPLMRRRHRRRRRRGAALSDDDDDDDEAASGSEAELSDDGDADDDGMELRAIGVERGAALVDSTRFENNVRRETDDDDADEAIRRVARDARFSLGADATSPPPLLPGHARPRAHSDDPSCSLFVHGASNAALAARLADVRVVALRDALTRALHAALQHQEQLQKQLQQQTRSDAAEGVRARIVVRPLPVTSEQRADAVVVERDSRTGLLRVAAFVGVGEHAYAVGVLRSRPPLLDVAVVGFAHDVGAVTVADASASEMLARLDQRLRTSCSELVAAVEHPNPLGTPPLASSLPPPPPPPASAARPAAAAPPRVPGAIVSSSFGDASPASYTSASFAPSLATSAAAASFGTLYSSESAGVASQPPPLYASEASTTPAPLFESVSGDAAPAPRTAPLFESVSGDAAAAAADIPTGLAASTSSNGAALFESAQSGTWFATPSHAFTKPAATASAAPASAPNAAGPAASAPAPAPSTATVTTSAQPVVEPVVDAQRGATSAQ